MDLKLKEIEEAIKLRLSPLNEKRQIYARSTPELDGDLVSFSGLGVCLIQIADFTTIGEPNKIGKSSSRLALTINVRLIQRYISSSPNTSQGGYTICYPTINEILNLLIGFKPIGSFGFGSLQLVSMLYGGVTPEDKHWIYNLSFTLPIDFLQDHC